LKIGYFISCTVLPETDHKTIPIDAHTFRGYSLLIECYYYLTSPARRYNSYKEIYSHPISICDDFIDFISERGNRHSGMLAHDNAAKEPDEVSTLFKRLMDNLRRLKLLFFVLILLLISQSCSWISAKSPVETPPKSPAEILTNAKQFMDAGEYQKAIDAYNVEYLKQPQDQALLKEYVKSLEDIKATSDKASEEEDFASAGKNYNVLLKNYPRFKVFDKRLSFNRTYLNKKLSHCKKSLSKQGFQEYRKGNLSGAIALWQSLLSIDPHNAEIKEALRIAKLQQKNLQENK
jgi:tetratricopeptide (TPR) repeat protein